MRDHKAMFLIHAIIVSITVVSCSTLKGDGDEGKHQSKQQDLSSPLLLTENECHNKNLTAFRCSADVRDKLCVATDFLVNLRCTENPDIFTSQQSLKFQCPLVLEKSFPLIDNKTVYEVISSLTNKSTCLVQCKEDLKKCESIFYLLKGVVSSANVHLKDIPKSSTKTDGDGKVEEPAQIVPDNAMRTEHESKEKKGDSAEVSSLFVEKTKIVGNNKNEPFNIAQPVIIKTEEVPKIENEPVKLIPVEETQDTTTKIIITSKVPTYELKNVPSLEENKGGQEDDEEGGDGFDDGDDVATKFNLAPNPIEESRPRTQINTAPFVEAEDSHFFIYFVSLACLTIIGYIAFHNKHKILALALEGRRGRSSRRSSRRPNSASYRKLDTSLEEAMTSQSSGVPTTHVIY